MSKSPQPRIAIIGAGPAGLTLGCLLHCRNIPFTLFDLRQCPSPQSVEEPAGTLDLHQDTGLAALEELGLLDTFHGMTPDCTEEQIVADLSGKILYRDDGDATGREPRPEISRNKLTQLLISAIPEAAIQWQHKLVALTRASSDNAQGFRQVELDFGDHGKHTFDLVIGADGAWSRVRTLVTDVKPEYTGMQNITIHIRHITKKHPELAKLVGTGTFFCLADRCGLVSQRAAQDTARMYAFVNTADEHYAATHALGTKTAADAKRLLLDGPFRRYGPAIKDLIEAACDDETACNPGAAVDIRPMYTLYANPEAMKTEQQKQHMSGVTLIGDAAHLMPPNGEGVNMAMKDALLLSRAIASSLEVCDGTQEEEKQKQLLPLLHKRLDRAVGEFEKDMAERAQAVATETVQLLDMMYGGDNCSETMADFFNSMAGGPPEE